MSYGVIAEKLLIHHCNKTLFYKSVFQELVVSYKGKNFTHSLLVSVLLAEVASYETLFKIL